MIRGGPRIPKISSTANPPRANRVSCVSSGQFMARKYRAVLPVVQGLLPTESGQRGFEDAHALARRARPRDEGPKGRKADEQRRAEVVDRRPETNREAGVLRLGAGAYAATELCIVSSVACQTRAVSRRWSIGWWTPRWPNGRITAIERAAFRAHLVAVLGRDLEAGDAMSAVRVGDLYLAYGCCLGRPAAVKAFATRYLARVRDYVRRFERVAVSADEVRRELEDILLLGRNGSGPRLAAYRGRGPLEHFVAAAARNVARTLLRRDGRILDAVRR